MGFDGSVGGTFFLEVGCLGGSRGFADIGEEFAAGFTGGLRGPSRELAATAGQVVVGARGDVAFVQFFARFLSAVHQIFIIAFAYILLCEGF